MNYFHSKKTNACIVVSDYGIYSSCYVYLWLLLALIIIIIIIGWHCFSHPSTHSFPCLQCWLFYTFFFLFRAVANGRNIILFFNSVSIHSRWVPSAQCSVKYIKNIWILYEFAFALAFLPFWRMNSIRVSSSSYTADLTSLYPYYMHNTP